jgi:hypothetical protein
MGEETTFPPIGLARRLDRSLRLGPFPSARDAMKFAAYAAAGTVALPFGGALAWLPVVGAGFLLAVVRPEGRGLDDRAGDYLRYQWRRRHRRRSTGKASGCPSAGRILTLPGPLLVAILETGGIPIRFLPPADARRLYDAFRELLRSLDAGVFLSVGSAPVPPLPRLPPPPGPSRALERGARAGYVEMLGLLMRRRARRQVRVVLFAPGVGAAAGPQLEARTRALAGRLAALGLDPVRLEGAALGRAAAAIGWPSGGPP